MRFAPASPWRGPFLVERDREERVRLVVLQPDVEPRAVLLDEVELEEQGLDLVADLDPLDGRPPPTICRVRSGRVAGGPK